MPQFPFTGTVYYQQFAVLACVHPLAMNAAVSIHWDSLLSTICCVGIYVVCRVLLSKLRVLFFVFDDIVCPFKAEIKCKVW
ncbi:hypothetical protein Mp_2g23240 [Marchantia polymorpha subsp. ruderalis]|uniref:Uncharacterized protein n=1 Tax=Marchantia polymorpha TaxID=3197 RepID=A0A2R6WN13_MARPO|nr:hypothetical protein MARPO_0072s0007 [Marchantia polymorpha]BBN03408.1 hypothetical protein Mp_2g23240 [Marchantia polymorpha subsp. ruderalis]|eukprot:PTQ35243.1 hypothetical protein MARPO_0072s0007 [Marchantia polymorpha]